MNEKNMSIDISDLQKYLRPSNLKYLIVLVGFYLIYRGFGAVEDSVIYLTPDGERMQFSLQSYGLQFEYYVLTMVWPIFFSLLNSIHNNIRVDKPFFNLIVYVHLASVNVALVGNILTVKKMGHLSLYDSFMFVFDSSSMIVYLASTLSVIFSFYWYNKKFLIFADTKKSGKFCEKCGSEINS